MWSYFRQTVHHTVGIVKNEPRGFLFEEQNQGIFESCHTHPPRSSYSDIVDLLTKICSLLKLAFLARQNGKTAKMIAIFLKGEARGFRKLQATLPNSTVEQIRGKYNEQCHY